MAGFKGYFTNHSLRATAATQVFDADIDEQLDQNSKYRRWSRSGQEVKPTFAKPSWREKANINFDDSANRT